MRSVLIRIALFLYKIAEDPQPASPDELFKDFCLAQVESVQGVSKHAWMNFYLGYIAGQSLNFFLYF